MSTIVYKILTPQYLGGGLEVMKKSFYVDETACKAVGVVGNSEAIAELEELTLRAARDGVSTIAIDSVHGIVVGVAFNKLQINSPNDVFFDTYAKSCKNESSKALVNFMLTVDSTCNLFEHCNVDCTLEIMFLAVLPEYRSLGIGKNLCKMSIDIGKRLFNGENIKHSIDGTVLPSEPVPKVVTAIFTSYITQKIGRNIGFKIANRVNYGDLVFQGKSFSSLLNENDRTRSPSCTLEFFRL